MNYIKISFPIQDQNDADTISALLCDLPTEGSEQTESALYIFFAESQFDEVEIKNRVVSFPFTTEIIPYQNWNAVWESNFEPIQINSQVGVRAHFHPPFKDCKYDIVITPKMSFGTGHHETTQMMMTMMNTLDYTNKDVLDFGCGTGVLAIFSKLKGAAIVKGIDNDEWSVENSIENCRNNHCEDIEISIEPLENIDYKYDIILANINLNVLLQTLPKLYSILKTKGDLLLSGILDTDFLTIQHCFTALGFTLIAQQQKKNWIALHIQK